MARWGLLAAWTAAALSLRATKTVAPFDMDAATFIPKLKHELGDHLILLYSPTCPDCQWFMSRWAALAQDLRATQLTVWTVADPGFLAPEPFVHWHNPAIFLAPAGNATAPVPFPAEGLDAYLKGDNRPQPVQDRAFRQFLLDFIADNSAGTLTFEPVKDDLAQADLNQLAQSAWRLLQKRWGVAPAAAAGAAKGGDAGQVQAPAGTLSGAAQPQVASFVSEYTSAYVKEHGPLSESARGYIEKYYRDYFLAHASAH
jgi:hypothetical protein